MWRWNCACFMYYTQCISFPGTRASKSKLAKCKPLWIFSAKMLTEMIGVHSQVALYFMIFQLRSYSRDPDKSTGILGNICGPVLCDGRKGQTEKKGGHLLHMLHLKLVMLAASTGHANLDLAGWLAALFFLSSTHGSSDFSELVAAYYSLQVKHKGPGLRSSAFLNSFHLELLAFHILLNLHAPYPTHCS